MKSRDPVFDHYWEMLHAPEGWIAKCQLKHGTLYLIHARNNHLGIWDAVGGAFVLVREKHGELRMSSEFHWDDGAPLGTVKPWQEVRGPIAPDDWEQALTDAADEIDYFEFMRRLPMP